MYIEKTVSYFFSWSHSLCFHIMTSCKSNQDYCTIGWCHIINGWSNYTTFANWIPSGLNWDKYIKYTMYKPAVIMWKWGETSQGKVPTTFYE